MNTFNCSFTLNVIAGVTLKVKPENLKSQKNSQVFFSAELSIKAIICYENETNNSRKDDL